MPADRTVVEHLLEGRDALVLEVQRLTTAIEELDAVIARIGGDQSADASITGRTAPARTPASKGASRAPRKTSGRAGRAAQSDGSKSIRIHVLEMLASEDRDFGLAEVIDRIHAQGIKAHDDAVRSITIKLMKDGRVERTGRGQYRLAHRETGQPAGYLPATGTDPQPVAGPVSD